MLMLKFSATDQSRLIMFPVLGAVVLFLVFVVFRITFPPHAVIADRPVQPQISYLLDASHDIAAADILSPETAARFAPVTSGEPSFGFTTDDIWLRFDQLNPASRDAQRFIAMGTNFMVFIEVWKLVDGQPPERLFLQTEHSRFSSREVKHHFLVAPLVMNAGEKAVIAIHYRSRGGTALPVQVESATSFALLAQSRTSHLFIYYTITFILTLASALAFIAFPRGEILAYGAYSASVTLYLSQIDGTAFQFLWPDAPEWNAISSLPLGCLVGLTAAFFARIFLDTRRTNPLADKVLLAIIAGCVLITVSPVFISESLAKGMATVWVTISAACFFAIGLHALRQFSMRTLFFVLGWFGIVSGTFLVTAQIFFGVTAAREFGLDVMRMAMVFDAFMMGLAMMFGILQLRRERDLSLRDHISETERNLALHKRLNEVENRYSIAVTEAERRGRVLTNASHDIRQPLFALRAAMRKLPSTGAETQADTIRRNLAYIEALVDDFLDRSKHNPEADTSDVTPVQAILSAVRSMFETDAKTAGIDLVVVDSSCAVATDAIALLRIVSNCVSNAIRHSQGKKVLVGCRRRGDTLAICIIDSGRGVPPEIASLVLDGGQSGKSMTDHPEGHGLGLSIARDMARQHGLKFTLRTAPMKGAAFMIEAPRV